ncbi:redoxin domain-containing protein [bacterium]|nr:redoxin domain-containing protein [bacterium]
MTKRSLALAVLALAGTIAAAAGQNAPERATIDQPVRDFKLKDVMAEKESFVTLSELKGKKTVVLFFVSDKCPVTWGYEQRTGKLIADFRKKDVVFLGIRSSAGDSAEEIKRYAEVKNFDIPILFDDRNVVADYYGARSTPQYAVIDTNGVLRYYGAFDDLQTARTWQTKESEAKAQYVRDALTAVLAGKDVSTKEAKGYG